MKHTLPGIEKVLKSYVDKLFQIDVEIDSEFNAAVKKAKDELLADIVAMRHQNPELFYLNYDKKMEQVSKDNFVYHCHNSLFPFKITINIEKEVDAYHEAYKNYLE